jgi:uncharacterized delta-60 repeat protein
VDTNFGVDGKAIADFGEFSEILTIAIRPDGKILAAGTDFKLARHNSDGSLDTTFDTDGKVTTDFGDRSGIAHDIAVQADGKIVV